MPRGAGGGSWTEPRAPRTAGEGGVRLPIYYFIKLAFLVFLFNEATRVRRAGARATGARCPGADSRRGVGGLGGPGALGQGAELLYNRAIRPLLMQNQTFIDRGVGRVAEEAQVLGDRAKDVGARVAAAVVTDKIHGQ